jgi:SEC-C motif
MLLNQWIETNRSEVERHYPQFDVVESSASTDAVVTWKGAIRPLDDNSELGLILHDLAYGNDLLSQRGTLRHDPDCADTHKHADVLLQKIKSTDQEFMIEVHGYSPPRHPKAFSVSPKITKDTCAGHPHLFTDGAICSDHPSDSSLPWDGRTIFWFLDFVAIWCAKHDFWVQSGGANGGLWLGPAAGHSLPDLLSIPVNSPCPCGSGFKYKRCHRREHEQQYLASLPRFR